MVYSGPEFREKLSEMFSQIINVQTAPRSVLKSAEEEEFLLLQSITLQDFDDSQLSEATIKTDEDGI